MTSCDDDDQDADALTSAHNIVSSPFFWCSNHFCILGLFWNLTCLDPELASQSIDFFGCFVLTNKHSFPILARKQARRWYFFVWFASFGLYQKATQTQTTAVCRAGPRDLEVTAAHKQKLSHDCGGSAEGRVR